MELEPVSMAATNGEKSLEKSAHSGISWWDKGLHQMSAESILIFPNLPLGFYSFPFSFFLILSSCIVSRMLMNHRLPGPAFTN